MHLILFGVHLFGTRDVLFKGSGGKTEAVIDYNYVDSSYVQMLFTYGVIPLVLLICLYVVISREQYKQGQYLYVVILSLVALNCMIEAFLVCPDLQYIHVFCCSQKNTFVNKSLNNF